MRRVLRRSVRRRTYELKTPLAHNPGGSMTVLMKMPVSKSSKVALLAASVVAAIVVVVATATALLLRVNAKPRVEAIASEVLGMEVRVGGRLAIGFLPGLRVSLTDVHVRSHGAEVAA